MCSRCWGLSKHGLVLTDKASYAKGYFMHKISGWHSWAHYLMSFVKMAKVFYGGKANIKEGGAAN
jgi:hypothetical protein